MTFHTIAPTASPIVRQPEVQSANLFVDLLPSMLSPSAPRGFFEHNAGAGASMAELSVLNLKPLSWSQSIGQNGRQSDGDTSIRVTCALTANCDVQLCTGLKLRDFLIPIAILEGQLPTDERSTFENDAAIGGLWFVEEQHFVHGWFYLKSRSYSTLWNQVRDGKADCRISLIVTPLHNHIWKHSPLSIANASLDFDRKPPADERKSSWLSRLFSR